MIWNDKKIDQKRANGICYVVSFFHSRRLGRNLKFDGGKEKMKQRETEQAIQLIEQYKRHCTGLQSECLEVREIALLACDLDMSLMWLLTQ